MSQAVVESKTFTEPSREGYSKIRIFRKDDVIETGLVPELGNQVFLIQ